MINKIGKITKDILTIIRAPAPKRTKFRLADLKFFFRFIKPVWKIGAISLLLVIVISALRSLLPLASKVFIDFVILKTGYSGIKGILTAIGLGAYGATFEALFGSIEFIAILMILGGLLFGLLFLVEGFMTSIYQQELTFNLQTSLFDHVMRFPMSFIKSKQTGYLMSRVSDDVNMVQYMFSDAISQIFSSAFYIVFGIVILLTLNWRLATIIAVVIPVYLVIRSMFSSSIRALSYREREANAEVSRNIQEAISGVEVVKSYATEKKELEKVSLRLKDVINTRISRSVLISLAGSFMRGTMFGLLLIVLVVGAYDIRNGVMTIGDYVAFITYITLLSSAVNTLFFTYMSFQPVLASMDRLKEMFGTAPEFDWDEKAKNLKRPEKITGDVRFDNVSFAYNVDEPILRDISFTVKHGESVALVGHSGAGKTTLVSLLLKLYVPQTGGIYLDGVNLDELDHSWLRQQISIVSQDIFLFNDTIENNIKYGKPDASREDVIIVAKKARIHDFIMSLPKGYDTLIGERGTKLSVGQRQRISIARAFLKNTPILVLDEPTSAIDPETEMYLKDSLAELMKGRTTFIISHRMSLTDIADKVVVIDDGKIGEMGTHKELTEKEGLYNKLRTFDGTHGD